MASRSTVLVTLTAYVPTLFASELRHWPIGRLLLFFALGFAYLAMGTKGWDWLVERTHSLAYAAVYFIIPAAIAIHHHLANHHISTPPG
ncbi:MAG: hypothetical protein R3E31_24670 [Chloroflexota bacterium]